MMKEACWLVKIFYLMEWFAVMEAAIISHGGVNLACPPFVHSSPQRQDKCSQSLNLSQPPTSKMKPSLLQHVRATRDHQNTNMSYYHALSSFIGPFLFNHASGKTIRQTNSMLHASDYEDWVNSGLPRQYW